MLGFGWLALRQAQDALNTGRLEEARRLLQSPAAQGHKRHGELLLQLARAHVERGERQLNRDDVEAAWDELHAAEQLDTAERSAERLRQALSRLGFAQVRALLQAGDPRRASQAVGALRDHQVRGAEMQMLEDTTRNWLTALDLADQGDFARALETVERLLKVFFGPSEALEELRRLLEDRQKRFVEYLGQLHEAADQGRWREVLELAELLLAVAPLHAEARKARGRAWKAIEPITVPFRAKAEESNAESPVEEAPPQRFFLWIDGVGGYLIFLGNRATLGQATPDGPADIPLGADVSRLHATLGRDGEGGYLLETSRPVQVNGQAVNKALLRPGDRITLGVTCQMQFHKPVPVSNSARLDVVSGHKLFPGIESVLLMGDTLLLGPTSQSHVVVPDLKNPVVLFRNKDGLGIRHTGSLAVNGEKVKERGPLPANATVIGDTFSFALEPVAGRR